MTLNIIALMISLISAIFCGFQALIIFKQKNLDLFKLRIGHYIELTQLMKKFKSLFQKDSTSILLRSNNIKDLEEMEKKILI